MVAMLYLTCLTRNALCLHSSSKPPASVHLEEVLSFLNQVSIFIEIWLINNGFADGLARPHHPPMDYIARGTFVLHA